MWSKREQNEYKNRDQPRIIEVRRKKLPIREVVKNFSFFVVKFSAVKDVFTVMLLNYVQKFPVGSNGEPSGIVKYLYKFYDPQDVCATKSVRFYKNYFP